MQGTAADVIKVAMVRIHERLRREGRAARLVLQVHDELLLEVRVPKLGPGWGWGFVEVSRRPGDFALVAAGALVRVAQTEIVEARVAVGGVAERPVRAAAVEMAVAGSGPGDLDRRVAPIEGIEPVSDTGATQEHRRHLARVLVVRALEDAVARAEEAA